MFMLSFRTRDPKANSMLLHGQILRFSKFEGLVTVNKIGIRTNPVDTVIYAAPIPN